MRRLIVDVAIWLGVEAATLIALAIVGASQSWRESTMFTAGALAGWIVRGWKEDEDAERKEQEEQRHD